MWRWCGEGKEEKTDGEFPGGPRAFGHAPSAAAEGPAPSAQRGGGRAGSAQDGDNRSSSCSSPTSAVQQRLAGDSLAQRPQ